ncbi:MAG: DUF2087 domain-containing protein [Rubrivivax sp.]|nr:DUF2087 domain-containing protein [Rubrivivax sp.]
MPSPALPLAVPDVSAFARSLGRSLHERHRDRLDPPSHVELLNLIARAAGHRNFQALRAAPPPVLEPPAPDDGYADALDPPDGGDDAPAAPLSENARKALGHFDRHGRLMRWPVKFSVQKLAMWVLWTRFDAKRTYTEAEVNAVLKRANLFFDHVTLRRELINHQLMARKSDCSEYRKLPARPDDEARALLTAWRARVRATAQSQSLTSA